MEENEFLNYDLMPDYKDEFKNGRNSLTSWKLWGIMEN